MQLKRAVTIGLACLLMGCTRPWTETSLTTPPSVWVTGQAPNPAGLVTTPTLSYALPTARPPGANLPTPTADAPHYVNGTRDEPGTYIVQPGDMLSAIAERYSVSVEAIAEANSIADPDALEIGQTLVIPAVTPQAPGPANKLIPDSGLVYGPLSASFDIGEFINIQGGYLAKFNQDVNGATLQADQVIQLISENYSIDPRLLLALLEYRSGWVSNPDPDPALSDTPMGYIDDWYVGLYRQLAWSAIQLNSGFYRWQENSVTDWLLEDGSVVPIDPTINAGTAGVQNFFGHRDDYETWLRDVSPEGFLATYTRLFGSPFNRFIETLVPKGLTQPILMLPFGPGEVWAFTGGPHSAWDAGTPFGALDFAPPGEALGCIESEYWVTAVANGLVTRTGDGVVILDLDGDGNEGSGWVIVYMHIESRGRVQPGTILHAGERVGHPSCEGGISSGTHVHLARKFNGVWLAATGSVPFNLSGWITSGTGEEYVGNLTRYGVVVESYEGNDPSNQIQR